MRTDQILILTAVQMEDRAVGRAIGQGGFRFCALGIRAKHLPDPSQLTGTSLIILAGVAGALDPTLKIGDVVLDDPEQLMPDNPLYRRGKIHTASQIIATPAQKAELFKATGALAVDMEQAVVRDFAGSFNIPVVGLRAISDTADQTLDPAVVNLIDDRGRPRPIGVAKTLITRPRLIPYLRALNANTTLALERLCISLRALLLV